MPQPNRALHDQACSSATCAQRSARLACASGVTMRRRMARARRAASAGAGPSGACSSAVTVSCTSSPGSLWEANASSAQRAPPQAVGTRSRNSGWPNALPRRSLLGTLCAPACGEAISARNRPLGSCSSSPRVAASQANSCPPMPAGHIRLSEGTRCTRMRSSGGARSTRSRTRTPGSVSRASIRSDTRSPGATYDRVRPNGSTVAVAGASAAANGVPSPRRNSSR